LMAMIPQWFRSVMDPKVVDWAGGDLNKIQIDDSMRETYLKKFGTSSAGHSSSTSAVAS